jgi:hypothetical protein
MAGWSILIRYRPYIKTEHHSTTPTGGGTWQEGGNHKTRSRMWWGGGLGDNYVPFGSEEWVVDMAVYSLDGDGLLAARQLARRSRHTVG